MSQAFDLGARVVSGEIGDSDDGAIPLKSEYVDFFSSLATLTGGNYPVAKRLSRAEEDEINRHCVVLALMEEVFRTGRLDGRLATGKFSDAQSLISVAESVTATCRHPAKGSQARNRLRVPSRRYS